MTLIQRLEITALDGFGGKAEMLRKSSVIFHCQARTLAPQLAGVARRGPWRLRWFLGTRRTLVSFGQILIPDR